TSDPELVPDRAQHPSSRAPEIRRTAVGQHDLRTIPIESTDRLARCSIRSLLPDRYLEGVPMLRRALTVAVAVSAIAIGSSASAAAVTTIERSIESASAQSDLIVL